MARHAAGNRGDRSRREMTVAPDRLKLKHHSKPFAAVHFGRVPILLQKSEIEGLRQLKRLSDVVILRFLH
jgi:hypothetical protein